MCFFHIKMTVNDQISMIQQYDLDRKAAKIPALSSGNVDKYEYLTGEDLNYKPSTVG